MRRVVLDVDTGIDDALALLYAVVSPVLELCGVTTVVGNVPAEVAARNSAAVLGHAGAREVPVALGATTTLSGAGAREGASNHGPDGLGGVRLASARQSAYADPVAVLRTAADGGPATLAGLAPMTNLASLAHLADDLVLVAGELALEEPPELNAAHDPDATAHVLVSERPTTLYVADVFEQVAVAPGDVERLRSSARPAAALAGALLAVRRAHLVGDAGALVLLTHPHLFRVEPRRMGQVGAHLTEAGDGRVLPVAVEVDAPAVARTFVEALLAH
ncbi:nucleoside hydrolase [Nocardioides sp. zg-1228]|uniref:nucleoside hydrolase n=1 Tax=Nocardioides sp. zg-1228 TaxID=2763008 RepID=UPI001642EB59|nr:nucleoside hydrolase [Nocardioides sp. zg-1228]MBC2932359.1 nucleoside hydrolase [Nocardioides sp. zg-1228]QSF57873.1 nucleoside hydrolase [Nocardioides sp. zg-1228]